MNLVRSLIVCSVLTLLVACGGKKSSLPEGASAAARLSEDETLLLTIGLSPIGLNAGDHLHAFVAISNQSERPRTLNFNSGMTFDLEVMNDQNVVLFRWSDNQSFTQATRSVTLEPGERISEHLTVTFPPVGGVLDSGSYLVRTVLAGDMHMSTFPLTVHYNP